MLLIKSKNILDTQTQILLQKHNNVSPIVDRKVSDDTHTDDFITIFIWQTRCQQGVLYERVQCILCFFFFFRSAVLS